MSEKQFTELVTPHLLLRRFRPSDAIPFFNYRTLPDVARYQSDIWLRFTQVDAAAFAAAQAEAEPFVPGTWFQVAIERRDTGVLAGDIGIHTLEDTDAAELGFTIAPAHQRQGLAFEAVRHILDDLFRERGLRRVAGVADLRNTPSVRLMEKLGMTLEEAGGGEVRYAVTCENWVKK